MQIARRIQERNIQIIHFVVNEDARSYLEDESEDGSEDDKEGDVDQDEEDSDAEEAEIWKVYHPLYSVFLWLTFG